MFKSTNISSSIIISKDSALLKGSTVIQIIMNLEKKTYLNNFKSFWFLVKSENNIKEISKKYNRNNIKLLTNLLNSGSYIEFEISDVAGQESPDNSKCSISIEQIGDLDFYSISFKFQNLRNDYLDDINKFISQTFIDMDGIYGYIRSEIEDEYIDFYGVETKPTYFIDQITGIFWRNYLTKKHIEKLNRAKNRADEFVKLEKIGNSIIIISTAETPEKHISLLKSNKSIKIKKYFSPIAPIDYGIVSLHKELREFIDLSKITDYRQIINLNISNQELEEILISRIKFIHNTKQLYESINSILEEEFENIILPTIIDSCYKILNIKFNINISDLKKKKYKDISRNIILIDKFIESGGLKELLIEFKDESLLISLFGGYFGKTIQKNFESNWKISFDMNDKEFGYFRSVIKIKGSHSINPFDIVKNCFERNEKLYEKFENLIASVQGSKINN